MTDRVEPGYLIQIDGSSLGNPGPSGVGVRILSPNGDVIKELSHSIGVCTNNQAEYGALLLALHEAQRLAPARTIIATDSELLYYQMTGKYRVRHARIAELHAEAQRLLAGQSHIGFKLVRRESNSDTDKLAKAGADAGRERTRLGC
jgi:ribonuclease H / adenosylcobalamin/alpha-ribazole phosphatase